MEKFLIAIKGSFTKTFYMQDVHSTTRLQGTKTVTKKVNRRSTQVDLTPMVDLGFLLITFFVFTTSMSQPMAMNLVEPKDGEPLNIKQSGAMTILLGSKQQLYYYYGLPDKEFPEHQIKNIGFKEARMLIAQKKKQTPLNELMYIIKSGEDASFGNTIDLLDEMTICNIPAGHFVEMDISAAEAAVLRSRDNF